jgi:hypothetical protein
VLESPIYFSWSDNTLKFLHGHLPIPLNLVKGVHKVLLDIQILCGSKRKG